MSIGIKLLIIQVLLIVLFIEEIFLSAAIHKANERIMLLETIQDRMREKVFQDNSEVLNHGDQ